MNDRFHIRRENMLLALGLPATIPVGRTGEWADVAVRTGHWHPGMGNPPPWREADILVLPKVRLLPRGVANRIRVLCPCCRAKWVRFSVLQQHAGTEACRVAGLKQSETAVVYDPVTNPAVAA